MMTIPPQITDCIIDQAQDDILTLFSCSLVCHNFLPRARFHSFRNITIGHPSSSNSPQRFLRLLLASPHIGWLVRVITVDTEPEFDGDASWEEMNDRINTLLWKTADARQWVYKDVVLAKILESLPNLEVFTAEALRWRSDDGIMPEAGTFESVLLRKSITTLTLNYIYFDSLPGFVKILESFNELKVLRLGVIIHTPSLGDSAVTLTQGSFGLQELEMNMEGCTSIVKLFARSPLVVSSAKRLVLKKCYRGQMELVRALVSLCSTSLEYLHVDDTELPGDFRKSLV